MKKSANRSFLRVCRQRTILSLGKFSESAIGEWEFSQSLPTENYVVIGRVLRVRQESRKTTGSFPRVCRQRTILSLGEFSDSAKRAESADGSLLRVCRRKTIVSLGKFSESTKRSKLADGSFLRVCRQRTIWSLSHWASSQILRREQTR